MIKNFTGKDMQIEINAHCNCIIRHKSDFRDNEIPLPDKAVQYADVLVIS